jgi:hypothetical protein
MAQQTPERPDTRPAEAPAGAAPAEAKPAIESKRDVLLGALRKFYADPGHLRVLTDVRNNDRIEGRAHDPAHRRCSLRILDWLVTNYSKKKNIVYLVPGPAGSPGEDASEAFNMYHAYKSQLKAYSKRYFDPFCRRDRLWFEDADGKTIETTVGQLNFFRWALLNGVVEYGTQHAVQIDEDMLQSIRHRGSSSGQPPGPRGKRKRRELSKAAIKGCTKTHVKVTVRFS